MRAAEKSNATAVIVASIELQRRHAELTPEFEIRGGGDSKEPDVWLKLVGPIGLDRLDEVKAIVVDDRDTGYFPGPKEGMPSEVSQEQIDAQVWGPYKFRDGWAGADGAGRTATLFALLYGIERVLSLVPTHCPPWWVGTTDAELEWACQFDYNIHLSLECHLKGFEPWTVPIAINGIQA